jgi:diguanylate cyclase (GGDEF)-like protein
MSTRAQVYVYGVIVAGLVFGALTWLDAHPLINSWIPLVVLSALATLSQLYKTVFTAEAGSDTTISLSPMMMFFSAGLILLPSSYFVLLVLIPHLVEWGKERYLKTRNLPVWYIQPFNIANHILNGLVAQKIYTALITSSLPGHSELVASLAASLAYALLNHAILGQALVFARGLTWKQTGLFTLWEFATDWMTLCMGVVLAILWQYDAALSILGLPALLLLKRAFSIPSLMREANEDSKTGLYNLRRFRELLDLEFKRAQRFNRPIAIIFADLDLLRNINNTYGHPAGDVVLIGISKIIKSSIREFDIPARFGGEEFIIALPETEIDQAKEVAERIRAQVEATEFHDKNTPQPIHATISLGIACYPRDAATSDDLIHMADQAVYQAKAQGRNRVVATSSAAPS